MTRETKIVIEKISDRILKEIDEWTMADGEYFDGVVDGLAKALQIVNGGKQDDSDRRC